MVNSSNSTYLLFLASTCIPLELQASCYYCCCRCGFWCCVHRSHVWWLLCCRCCWCYWSERSADMYRLASNQNSENKLGAHSHYTCCCCCQSRRRADSLALLKWKEFTPFSSRAFISNLRSSSRWRCHVADRPKPTYLMAALHMNCGRITAVWFGIHAQAVAEQIYRARGREERTEVVARPITSSNAVFIG